MQDHLIAGIDIIEMLLFFSQSGIKIFRKIMEGTDTQWLHPFNADTLTCFIGQREPSHICFVSVFLWAYIGHILICYAAVVCSYLCCCFSVGIVLPGAASIPAEVVILFMQTHLHSKSWYLRQTLSAGLPTSVDQ